MKPINLLSKTQKSVSFLCTMFMLLVAQSGFSQTVHTVDNRPESGAMFTTVSAAIAAAVAGDIIHIHPSPTSYGNVTINKTLTLIGLGHNPANEDGLRASITNLTINGVCPNSVIKGLNIGTINGNTGTNHDGIQIINNRLTSYVGGSQVVGRADDWVIEGNYMTSTAVAFYGYAGDNWRISNNWMRGSFSSLKNTTVIINNVIVNSSSGTPNIFASCNSPVVANNIFLFTGTANGVGLSSSTVNFNKCLTYSYAGTTLTALGGGVNFDNTDPVFTNVPTSSVTDFYNNDFSLAAGSTVIGQGTDNTDLGIFGRSFSFDINGRPDLSPYPTSIFITNNVIAPGQDLNVEFKASIKQ